MLDSEIASLAVNISNSLNDKCGGKVWQLTDIEYSFLSAARKYIEAFQEEKKKEMAS